MQSTPTITRDELRDIAEQGLNEFAVPQQLAAEVMGAVETLEIFQLGGFGARQDHTCIIGEVRKRRGLSGVGLIPRAERFERNPELELGAFYDQRVRRVTGISYADPRGIDGVKVVEHMPRGRDQAVRDTAAWAQDRKQRPLDGRGLSMWAIAYERPPATDG